MADEFIFVETDGIGAAARAEGDFFTTASAAPSAAARPRPLDRRLKFMVIVLASCLTLELVWLLGVTPWMPLTAVEIEGLGNLDRGLVLAQGGIGSRSSYMTVDCRAVELSLEALYAVETAKVEKKFPNRLTITLSGRRPAAFSLASLEGKELPVVYDRNGVVFQIGEFPAGFGAGNLPLLSGLVFEHPTLGMRLPAMLCPFLKELERVRSGSPELFRDISEIRIVPRGQGEETAEGGYNGFDLVLYPIKYPLRIRMGADLNEEKLGYMLLFVDIFKNLEIPVKELDFRSATAAYILKEASLGK